MKKFGSKDNRLTPRARQLRGATTDVERMLWYRLRNRQLLACKFRRQHPVAGYVLDFACEELQIAVELDGSQHAEVFAQQSDTVRTVRLQALGWQVVRFWNNEVIENMDGVLSVIMLALEDKIQGERAPHPTFEGEC
jgi:very-short-patch-repair endonuclease